MKITPLVSKTEITVRFCEVDPMHIVWHGNYIKYFEDGREDFGEKYGLSYSTIFNNQLLTPIVKMQCEYRCSLTFGEKAIVETQYVNTEAAKIIFKYKIFRKSNSELVATGESVQVFLNIQKELQLTHPQFFLDWKKRWGIH
ncbi:MAG: acyl-CoA thioesterase [Lentimicrobiaceae bacterium]|jgi:acyl-CoA thioester hydrolase|nr:acyl-CoA thioesterase [Lentimicrobiaceae bacterium]